MRSPIDVLVERSRRTEQMLVSHDRRRWLQVLVIDLGLFVLSVAAWSLWPITRDTWWGIVGGILVGVQLGRVAIVAARRAQAYRSGWLAGRQQMIVALAESQRRGMHPMEWLEGEADRDWAVLGLDPSEIRDAIAEARRQAEEE